MSYTQPEDEAGTRLMQYNDGAWDPATNPLGFDAGGNQAGVFTRMLKDVASFLRATVRIVTQQRASVAETALRFETAVAAIEAGPVVSVVGRSGIVTADHIKTAIGYDQLAADIEQDVEQTVSGLTGRVDALEADFPTRALILSQALALTGIR